MIGYFLNPARLLRFAAALMPLLGAAAFGLIAWGLYLSWFASPIDYQQGDSVRIMYVHVPSAWLGLALYAAAALFAGIGLVMRNPFAHAISQSVIPVGAAFTAVCLITGSLWGKASWGTWWVWDARLTSMLVLFLLYAGHMALTRALTEQPRRDYAGAVLLLIGSVNLPIIKFSVAWWQTLHQPASLLRKGGAAIDPSMLKPLLVMAGGQLCLAALLVLIHLSGEIARRKAIMIEQKNLLA